MDYFIDSNCFIDLIPLTLKMHIVSNLYFLNTLWQTDQKNCATFGGHINQNCRVSFFLKVPADLYAKFGLWVCVNETLISFKSACIY